MISLTNQIDSGIPTKLSILFNLNKQKICMYIVNLDPIFKVAISLNVLSRNMSNTDAPALSISILFMISTATLNHAGISILFDLNHSSYYISLVQEP